MVSKVRREASGACLDHVSGRLLGDDAEGGVREAQPQRSEWRAATVSELELGGNHLAGGGRGQTVRHRWNVARPCETRTGAGREELSGDWGIRLAQEQRVWQTLEHRLQQWHWPHHG